MGKDGKSYSSQSTFVKNMWGTTRGNLMTMFGADLRSMALFRILIGVTVILDLFNRSSDLYAHYSDAGILPRSLVLSHFQNDLWICIHMMSGLWTVQAVLFLIHALFAFSLTIGYYTRSSLFLTWVLTLSLHNRNYIVLHGGDVLQRVILFFALFLPLGDCYSIDNAYFNSKNKLSGKKKLYNEQHYRYINVATFAIMIQISLMYVTSYIHKTGMEWTTWRTSTWLALQLDYFRTPIGDFFLWFPDLLKWLTASVLWWEGFGPVFFFLPVMTGPSRFFGVLGFWGMHLGFQLCLRLGQFGCMGMSAIIAGLPTWFWEEIVFRRLKTRERTGFKLYYNPSSSFSTNFAIFVSNFLVINETTVLPIPSDEEERSTEWPSDDASDVKPSRTFSSVNSSWLITEDYKGNTASDYDAIYAICQVSPVVWPLTFVLRSPAVSKRLRVFVRYYGQQWAVTTKITPSTSSSSTALPPAQAVIRQFWKLFKLIISNIICFLCLFYVLSWNAGNIGWHNYTVPNDLRWIAWFIHLDQSWSMFSPRPPSVQWYYIIDGTLDDGRTVELFRNEALFTWEPNELVWEKPDPFAPSFKNHRWFKFYENGVNSHPNNDQLRLHWGRYICREYNARHHGVDRLHRFSINWMSERAEPDSPRVMLPKQTIWNHMCYEK